METQPPAVATADTPSLTALSPSEVVWMFADRLFVSHDSAAMSDVRVPLSGRYVDLEVLSSGAFATAMEALHAAGEVTVSLRSRKLVPPRVFLTALRPAGDWPANSVEARVGRWLANQPGSEGWLDDLVIEGLPHTRSAPTEPAFSYFALGLMERGVVQIVKRRSFLVFNTREYQVAEAWGVALSGAQEPAIREHLACQGTLDSNVRTRCRETWCSLSMQMDSGY